MEIYYLVNTVGGLIIIIVTIISLQAQNIYVWKFYANTQLLHKDT